MKRCRIRVQKHNPRVIQKGFGPCLNAATTYMNSNADPIEAVDY